MNYDGSGVKIDQLPGWVGQNWSLNTGGIITRSVRNVADEIGVSTGMDYLIQHFSYFQTVISNLPTFNEASTNTRQELIDFTNARLLNDQAPYDTEADIFHFNFMGYSGKFFLDQTGVWRVQSEHNLKVEFDYTDINNYVEPFINYVPVTTFQVPNFKFQKVINGFTIIDDSGYRYTFGKTANSREYSIPFFKHYSTVTGFLKPLLFGISLSGAPGASRMHEIARELNKSGVPTRRKARTADGGYWRSATVRNLLSNSIYKGVFIWNCSTVAKARAKNEGRDLEPMHYLRPELRLVSDELWDRCNDKTISRSGYGGAKHALAGLVSCGCCHGTLVLSSVSRCRSLYCANCTVAKSSDGQKQRLTQTIATVGVQTLLVESARHFLSEDFVEAFRDALRSRLAGGNQAELDSDRAELRKLERAQTRLLNIRETAEDDDELLAERYAGIREQG